MKLSEIVAAAGSSKAYASYVRRGKWTPHVSTWEALAVWLTGSSNVGEEDPEESESAIARHWDPFR
ncbi:MAG: hypothetical protein ABSD85_11710 [Acidimicrobiales bacterium]